MSFDPLVDINLAGPNVATVMRQEASLTPNAATGLRIRIILEGIHVRWPLSLSDFYWVTACSDAEYAVITDSKRNRAGLGGVFRNVAAPDWLNFDRATVFQSVNNPRRDVALGFLFFESDHPYLRRRIFAHPSIGKIKELSFQPDTPESTEVAEKLIELMDPGDVEDTIKKTVFPLTERSNYKLGQFFPLHFDRQRGTAIFSVTPVDHTLEPAEFFYREASIPAATSTWSDQILIESDGQLSIFAKRYVDRVPTSDSASITFIDSGGSSVKNFRITNAYRTNTFNVSAGRHTVEVTSRTYPLDLRIMWSAES